MPTPRSKANTGTRSGDSQSSVSARRKKSDRTKGKLQLDLALQGGGSHGAFTWGVLDRLLEEEWLEISGISGTSAGAMNAVAMAAGLMENGRFGARENLERFWRRVASASPFGVDWHIHDVTAPLVQASRPWWDALLAPWQQWSQMWGSQLSPYQFNPLNLNPLRDILEDTVKFERVRDCNRTQLYIAATQVRTGALRVFRQEELTADMVLASACLPMLFQAVTVNGEAYWDGGYAGNPTLMPLVRETDADDLLLVQINPSERLDVPTSAQDIMDRTSEVTFNSSLLKELRSIGLLKELIGHTHCPTGNSGQADFFQRVERLRLHRLDGDEALSRWGVGSKLQTDWAFIAELKAAGRLACEAWLQRHSGDLGRQSSFEVPPELLTQ